MAELRVTQHFDAPAEAVFDAWLNPSIARRFLFATADGEMIRADVDARVGGRFNFTDRRPDMGEVEHVGQYLEIDRPRRLAFTFAVPKYDPRETTVTIDMAASGATCELILTHRGVPPEWQEPTRQGWNSILQALAGALTP